MRTGSPWLAALALLAGCATSPAVDAGPITLGSPCDLFAYIDECNATGYVCTPVDGGNTCQYPELGDSCLPSVGCDRDAGGLSCYELTVDGGPQAVVPFCGTFCNVALDCSDPTDACDLAYLPDGGQVGACQPTACDDLFAPCQVDADPDGGTCVPIDSVGDGACQQNGPVGLNGACSGTTVDGGAYLCAAELFCGEGPSGATACFAWCGGSLTCPSGTTCVPAYGLCLTPCSGASSACDSPYKCQALVGNNGALLGSYCSLP